MSYFSAVSFILGIMIGFGSLWFLLAPDSYRRLAIRFIPEKRPGWFLLSGLAMLVWAGYSWYLFFDVPTPVGVAISFVLSLTLIKGYFACFQYDRFRAFALKFLNFDNAMLRVFGLLYLATASVLLALGAYSF